LKFWFHPLTIVVVPFRTEFLAPLQRSGGAEVQGKGRWWEVMVFCNLSGVMTVLSVDSDPGLNAAHMTKANFPNVVITFKGRK